MAYQRVLLKLSGEALGSPQTGQGFDAESKARIARQIARAAELGCELAIVVGGGNILRGATFSAVTSRLGAHRASADYMGMLATVINALALSDALENLGRETRVLTAIEISKVAEPFVRRRALKHLGNGRIVILFCALEGPPPIVRLHGRGTLITADHERFATFAAAFPPNPGTRSFIHVAVDRVSDSCGYAVPLYAFQGPRPTLDRWAEKKGEAGLAAYRAENNRHSIDGLPALPDERFPEADR